MDLDEIADRLYALAPAEFTAAREAEARAAKEAGDAPLSRAVAKLRKPTVSAWAVNQAVRNHRKELGELLALGEELRAAWQAQDADALAELTKRRAKVTAKVSKLVRAGLSAAAATEVDQTLDAATVDAEAAEQVRQGRLAKPLSYSGFAPAPIPRTRPEKKPGPIEEDEAKRAKEHEEAEAAYQEWRDALAAAVQQQQERAEKAAKLERKLTKARKKLAEADQRVEVTKREERHARQRLDKTR